MENMDHLKGPQIAVMCRREAPMLETKETQLLATKEILTQHLLSIITKTPEPIHVTTLYTLSPYASVFQVHRALSALLRTSQIQRPSRGFYAKATPTPIFPPSPTAARPLDTQPANTVNEPAARPLEPQPANSFNETAARPLDPELANILKGLAAITLDPELANILNGIATTTLDPELANLLKGFATTTLDPEGTSL
jgi:hypothetical protein